MTRRSTVGCTREPLPIFLQGRTVMEVANCAYEGVENWGLPVNFSIASAVFAKLALKVDRSSIWTG